MKSTAWIDRLISEKNLASDNQAAKLIGLTRGAISHHRQGIVTTLKEESCLQLAEALGIDPAIVLMDQAAERAKTPALRKQFERLGKLAGQGAAAALAIWTILPVAGIDSPAASTAYAAAKAINSILC